MITIRPDAAERLAEIQTIILMLRATEAPEMRKQYIDRLERIVDMLAGSVEEREG